MTANQARLISDCANNKALKRLLYLIKEAAETGDYHLSASQVERAIHEFVFRDEELLNKIIEKIQELGYRIEHEDFQANHEFEIRWD